MTEAIERKTRRAIEKRNVSLERLSIEYIPIDSVVPNDYNPNRQSDHDFNLLLKSMQEDGFTTPILVLPSKEIVDGEHRWRAAKEINRLMAEKGKPEPYREVPVVVVDMPPEQARIATLRHNRARGSEDIELAAAVLRDLERLEALDWAQDSLMLSDIEIQRMLHDVAAPEALADEEFSTAWVPEGTRMGSEDRQDGYIGGAASLEGITESAADRRRTAEAALAVAKTDEERQAVMKDRDIYRIALTFDGEQAQIVRKVLGEKPADKMLAMCKSELGLEG